MNKEEYDPKKLLELLSRKIPEERVFALEILDELAKMGVPRERLIDAWQWFENNSTLDYLAEEKKYA